MKRTGHWSIWYRSSDKQVHSPSWPEIGPHHSNNNNNFGTVKLDVNMVWSFKVAEVWEDQRCAGLTENPRVKELCSFICQYVHFQQL